MMNNSDSERGLVCGADQFHCMNTISNTILSINEWNREGESCIDARLRCDGRLVLLGLIFCYPCDFRHDCQDGLDEHECRFDSHHIPRHFW